MLCNLFGCILNLRIETEGSQKLGSFSGGTHPYRVPAYTHIYTHTRRLAPVTLRVSTSSYFSEKYHWSQVIKKKKLEKNVNSVLFDEQQHKRWGGILIIQGTPSSKKLLHIKRTKVF